jgi:hypothetical protein
MMKYMGIKLGPALKIGNIVQRIKQKRHLWTPLKRSTKVSLFFIILTTPKLLSPQIILHIRFSTFYQCYHERRRKKICVLDQRLVDLRFRITYFGCKKKKELESSFVITRCELVAQLRNSRSILPDPFLRMNPKLCHKYILPSLFLSKRIQVCWVCLVFSWSLKSCHSFAVLLNWKGAFQLL